MKKITGILLLFLIVSFFTGCSGKNPVDPADLIYAPRAHSKVVVQGREIYVNDKKYVAKGVGYQPTPIGYTPSNYDFFNDANIYKRDLSYLSSMGCNTIRTWKEVNSRAFLDECHRNNIMVIMGFGFNANTVVSSDALKQITIDNFKAYVNSFKDHPAVLMWGIGNEYNLSLSVSTNAFYAFINQLAKAAHEAEGGMFHPTMYPNGGHTSDGGVGTIGIAQNKTDDASMIYLDVWGANCYRDVYPTFGAVFDNYKVKSTKPLILTEYGVDAYDGNNSRTYEDVQASWTVQLWNEIAANSDSCVGGCIMAYSDEWWKGSGSDPNVHGFEGGGGRADQPDNYSHEQWYGIMSVALSGTGGADILTPRQLYYSLKAIW
ncbi:MAG: hypothetical protein KKH98_12375 [Spirochaetes bacterium]|nr:hypothetical protein [Spirochaetota bacterium]